MILFKTNIRSADNSGSKIFKCIKILNGHKSRFASVGDLVLVSIKKIWKRKKVEKKEICYVLLTSTKKNIKRCDGTYLKFDKNKGLTLNKQFKFLGTRIYGPIPKEIRLVKFGLTYKQIISKSEATI